MDIQRYANFVIDEASQAGANFERVLSMEVAYAIQYGMDVMRDAIVDKLEVWDGDNFDLVLDDVKAMTIDELPLDEGDEDEPYENELIDDELFEEQWYVTED